MLNELTKHSEAYNFAPDENDTMTVEALVKKAIDCWGGGDYKIESHTDNVHEAGLLKLSNVKAKNELGWNPVYNSSEAIDRTIEWYKKSFNQNTNKFELCIEDIRGYESQIFSEV